MLDVEEIAANFAFLDDWNERYRYLIELGRELDPLPDAAHNEVNRVKGCASQVWLETEVSGRDLALALYDDRPARDIATIDATQWFVRLGLSEHLTPQRSNGFRAMVERIRRDARDALAPQQDGPSTSSPSTV
jgi:cysteine desulfuration protein SufE